MPATTTLQLHGFDTPGFVETNVYREFSRGYDQIHARRRLRWDEYDLYEHPKRSRRLKRFCRKGIPWDYRPEVWLHVSGAAKRLMENPGVYGAAADGQPPQKLLSVILSDIPRTFPENKYFRDSSNPQSKLKSLQRVLTAFAVLFPEVGYCQGFNYIAAVLLLILRGSADVVEEQAFWLLDALINRTVATYYSDMFAVRVDSMVLGELVRSKAPELHRIIKSFGLNYTVLCAKWFICLFADVLPIETTLRVFDCLFYEGEKVLFRAGMALILMHRDQLADCTEFPSLVTSFRSMCQDQQTLWCHEFVKAMFTLPGSLTRNTIQKLRRRCEAILSSGEEG